MHTFPSLTLFVLLHRPVGRLVPFSTYLLLYINHKFLSLRHSKRVWRVYWRFFVLKYGNFAYCHTRWSINVLQSWKLLHGTMWYIDIPPRIFTLAIERVIKWRSDSQSFVLISQNCFTFVSSFLRMFSNNQKKSIIFYFSLNLRVWFA